MKSSGKQEQVNNDGDDDIDIEKTIDMPQSNDASASVTNDKDKEVISDEQVENDRGSNETEAKDVGKK